MKFKCTELNYESCIHTVIEHAHCFTDPCPLLFWSKNLFFYLIFIILIQSLNSQWYVFSYRMNTHLPTHPSNLSTRILTITSTYFSDPLLFQPPFLSPSGHYPEVFLAIPLISNKIFLIPNIYVHLSNIAFSFTCFWIVKKEYSIICSLLGLDTLI